MTLFTLQPAWRRQKLVTNILAIWKRAQQREQRIQRAQVKFRVGQHVRISREKMLFAKGSEQISVQKFSKLLVIRRIPRPVYELEDLNHTPIDGNSMPKN
jgi:hypothetical protein